MKSMTAEEMFLKAAFIRSMGIELLKIGNGVCETRLKIRSDLLQQDCFVHAGVITTLADHSCGGAAGSLLQPGEHILTAEFKTTFLRAAKSSELFCIAKCLKRGRGLAYTEASVYSSPLYDDESLIARMSSTLSIRVLNSSTSSSS